TPCAACVGVAALADHPGGGGLLWPQRRVDPALAVRAEANGAPPRQGAHPHRPGGAGRADPGERDPGARHRCCDPGGIPSGGGPMSKSGAANPARLEVVVENIPERIRKLSRWVVWRWRRRKQKWDKPPLQTSGALASVDDPTTWCSFAEA